MTGNVNFYQKKRKAPPAQALVEVAILLPMLLLLVLGAMDFGRMFYTKIVLTNAAREGANYLAYKPIDTNYAETKAIISGEILNSGVVGSSSEITVLPVNDPIPGNSMGVIVSITVLPVGCCTRGSFVEVTVRATNIPLIFGGFYHQFFTTGETLTLSSTVRMMVQ